MRVLKTYCPDCGSLATIQKTDWTDETDHKSASLYCACRDVECGHTFVLNLTYSHTLSPSAAKGGRLIRELVNQMRPDQQRQFALDLLQAAQ